MNTNFRYIIILLLANLLFLSSEANGQNLSPASGEINGHQWVDLGLPSGLKWATCNVGASTPEDPGDYFAYGEVSEKDSYVFNNSINIQKEIRHISGKSEYDAATVQWGKEWRIPTYHEFDELEFNCRMEWTTINGRNGYKLTSLINGASIFLPATGLVDGTEPEFTQECGWYWYSGIYHAQANYQNIERPQYAPSFTFSAESRYRGFNARYLGQCIRPVSGRNRHVENPQTGTITGHEWVDLGLPSGTRWATCNVGASSPTKPGKHFSWGETASKSSYTTSRLSEMDVEDIAGNPAYDAATAAWGKNWRMPTEENFRELTRYCDFEYVVIDGVKGMQFTSYQNNKSIFLPSTGYMEGTTLNLRGTNGFYWASTTGYDSNTGAHGYIFGTAGGEVSGGGDKGYGYCVRPVTDNIPMEAKEIVPYDGEIGGHRWVDLGLPSGLKWATYNVGATSAEQLGRLFKWGEIYDVFDKRPKNNLSKKPIRDIQGNPAYDAARANWGGTWRLPSEEDFQELINNCTIAFAYICGTRGFKLTSKINGKYVFLPEAGCDRSGYQEVFFDLGWGNCEYWSSTSKDIYLYTYEDVGVSLSISQNLSIMNWDEEKKAYDNRYVGKLIKIEGGPRWYSRAIRPVSD